MNKIRTKIAKYIAPNGTKVLTEQEFNDSIHVAQHSTVSEIMEYIRMLHGAEHWGECVWKYLCRKFDETK